eukprot:103046_1
MDDFLGTSIQYSEQQILLLEKQHEADLQKTVEDLIASGFLDSDYDSTESEPEYTDTQSVDAEVTDETAFASPLDSDCDSIDLESTMSISPRTLSNRSSSSNLLHLSDANSNLAMVLYSTADLSAMDMPASADSRFGKHFAHLMDVIVSDIKSLILLFVLMVAMPHINLMEHDTHSSVSGHTIPLLPHHSFNMGRNPSFYWLFEDPSSAKDEPHQMKMDSNESEEEDDDERDEYAPKHDLERKLHRVLYDFDVWSALNAPYPMPMPPPCDLLCEKTPRLLFHFGAGLPGCCKSPQIARIFRDTVSQPVGRHFVRSHHLTLPALVMSFVGIAAFAASNSNIDEYLV